MRVILGSTHSDRYDVLDFLVERHNHLQDQVWESQKTGAKNYREHIYFVYFVLKLAEREKHPGSIIILKMIPCLSGKKIRASHCFDVTSLITKGIIIFCWGMIVGMLVVTEGI